MIDTSKEAVAAMAEKYDERVRQHAGLRDLVHGEHRIHRTQEVADFHKATAETLRALRAELDEAKAEIDRLRADRPFISGFVEGFDAAVKECEALVREKFEKCRKVSMTYTGLDAASDISDLKGTSDD